MTNFRRMSGFCFVSKNALKMRSLAPVRLVRDVNLEARNYNFVVGIRNYSTVSDNEKSPSGRNRLLNGNQMVSAANRLTASNVVQPWQLFGRRTLSYYGNIGGNNYCYLGSRKASDRRCYSSVISSPLPEITDAFPHLDSYEKIYRFSLEEVSKDLGFCVYYLNSIVHMDKM